LLEVLFGRILEIDREMDVRHAQPADARGLIGERLLVGVQPEIDDVFDAERLDIGELRFGRLTGGRDPARRAGASCKCLRGRSSGGTPLADGRVVAAPASNRRRHVNLASISVSLESGPMRDLVAPAGAGIVYTLAVFTIGFVLGMIRVLLVVPRLGENIEITGRDLREKPATAGRLEGFESAYLGSA